MTVAVSVSAGDGRRGRGLRLDREHLGLGGRVRRQGRAAADRAAARRADRHRQARPGHRARRQGGADRGELRRLPASWPAKLADDYPVALVNSVNPIRIEGQKTAAFEIVDELGDAPDLHVLPVGNGGNISAYWRGYTQYAAGRAGHRGPRGCGAFQAAGAAPLVLGHPVDRSRDRGHRDPDRQPGLGRTGRRRPRRVRRPVRSGHRRADPRRPGVPGGSGGRLRRAGLGRRGGRAAGQARARRGRARTADRRHRHRARAQGRRHRPVRRGRRSRPRSVAGGSAGQSPRSAAAPAEDGPHDADRTARDRRQRSRSRCRRPARTSDPASTASGWRSTGGSGSASR